MVVYQNGTKSFKKMKVSKEHAAICQLCDAIELFRKEKYVSAITLAAASEEVLAQLVYLHAEKTPNRASLRLICVCDKPACHYVVSYQIASISPIALACLARV
jgi:hypothetical protein